jgi:lipopolysaccharide export system protein LptA
MMACPFSLFGLTPVTRVPAVIGAVLLWATMAAGAGPDPAGEAVKKASPIHITSDLLVSDSRNNSAEFSGNVKVVQDQTTITADRLVLVYNKDASAEGASGADSIDRVEATGHVRIEMDGRVAESERAVYRTDSRTLVLSGQGSKVISGKDVIESSKITFYRDTGNVKMEGDKENQVKAIIRSDQRGLN